MHINTHTHTYPHTYMHKCKRTHAHKYTDGRVCMCTDVFSHSYVHSRTQVQQHMHVHFTHIHAHARTLQKVPVTLNKGDRKPPSLTSLPPSLHPETVSTKKTKALVVCSNAYNDLCFHFSMFWVPQIKTLSPTLNWGASEQLCILCFGWPDALTWVRVQFI